MEAICSSQTSLDIQRTTRRYIPEDGTLHNTAVRTSNPTIVNTSIIRILIQPELFSLNSYFKIWAYITLRGETPAGYDPDCVTTAWVSCILLARERCHSSIASRFWEGKKARRTKLKGRGMRRKEDKQKYFNKWWRTEGEEFVSLSSWAPGQRCSDPDVCVWIASDWPQGRRLSDMTVAWPFDPTPSMFVLHSSQSCSLTRVTCLPDVRMWMWGCPHFLHTRVRFTDSK
jgi:hypothetical protein